MPACSPGPAVVFGVDRTLGVLAGILNLLFAAYFCRQVVVVRRMRTRLSGAPLVPRSTVVDPSIQEHGHA